MYLRKVVGKLALEACLMGVGAGVFMAVVSALYSTIAAVGA